MKIIKSSKGDFDILVDDEDFGWLSRHTWHIHETKGRETKYAFTMVNKLKFYMHRVVLGTPENRALIPDHINRNGLDNQKSNLRWVPHSSNNQNCPRKQGRSQYRGVSWITRDQRWVTRIVKDRVTYRGGRFTDEIEAAKAYDRLALELFGPLAYTNFPKASA